ncbi:DUF192 domain-containing protein [Neolewinella antarctica]|uniref:DUF192 domain-containing protein n=1 Tax=Neolewinella antarctica TaxID=442734 RepID=A0ABX0XE02_9BACT|nr:DUF192 domain-containing protein [Neolewinella antarctica]NJC27156.1 hypothetical protein [Neolewinella antarctica]
MSAPKYKAKSKINWSKIFIIGLLGLALLAFILQSIPSSGRSQPVAQQQPPAQAPAPPPFTDEGDLFITDGETGEQKARVDIELAQNANETAQGLMYREEMGEDEGMLFFMPTFEPQSFWMRNTLISLDIIYLNEQQEIVSIMPNTTPLSEAQVPSGVPARYVLEVNAGFAERKGLEIGDLMAW